MLLKRYEMYASELDQEEGPAEGPEGEAVTPHANEHPMMVMVDESTGNKYMRVVGHKGLEGEGDNSWLVKDMHQEQRSWGYPGGARNACILKSDGEPAIVAVREALARCHGGRITPEQPPRCEHQANGAAEEAGRTIRDHARVLKLDLEEKL